jgi:hypothetical protein
MTIKFIHRLVSKSTHGLLQKHVAFTSGVIIVIVLLMVVCVSPHVCHWANSPIEFGGHTHESVVLEASRRKLLSVR